MAFWKAAGFSQPSPIEQILDKEEFTLEELLDEDDIIQECKSLNGRLITFLREKKTVEQLLRYLIDPPTDSDDPKKQYRYPFTSCEVFCCEVEAIFNTLLEDEDLLRLLFSLLNQARPLSCKAAGYFGRVVGQLLLRKTNEMMQHLSHNDEILEKLIQHVDTTSIADIIKRLVGADDHSSMIFSPMHTQWLADTPLVTMLLDRLGPQYSTHVQANAADILTAIAHTQPSALATQLMQQQSIQALFSEALQPGSTVLVTALDVCAALLEPRRALDPGILPGGPGGTDNGGPTPGGSSSSSGHAAAEAITGMLQYLPQLMAHLRSPVAGDSSGDGISKGSGGVSTSSASEAAPAEDAGKGSAGGASSGQAPSSDGGATDKSSQEDKGSTAGGSKEAAVGSSSTAEGAAQDSMQGADPTTSSSGSGAEDITVRLETPYGVLQPPLGRARLRIVELLAALLRVGEDAVDAALIQAQSLQIVQELFVAYPFNNLLHHQMYALLLAVLRRASPVMVAHMFGDCQLVGWLLGLPQEVTPIPRPGRTNKVALRAGYLGHVTRIGQVLQEAAAQQQEIADVLQADPSWPELLQQLGTRFELEDVTCWQCGRPANTRGNELDSDGDEFPNDMESLEQIQGMPPGMYHRYGVLDDDMEDEEDDSTEHAGDFGSAAGANSGSGGIYNADLLVAGMAGLEVDDPVESSADGADGAAAGAAAAGGAAGEGGSAAAESAAAGGQGTWSLMAHPGPSSSAVDIPGERLMDDDAVLLADDEDMGALTASTLDSSPPPGDLGNAAAASPPSDDMVLVEDADVLTPPSSGADAAASSSPAAPADAPMADAGAAEAPATSGSPAVVVSSNPFAAASNEASSEASAAAADGDSPASPAAGAAAKASPAPAEGAAAAAATVTVDKVAPGELAEGKGLARDSNSKRAAAMSSHPVEVPEELT